MTHRNLRSKILLEANKIPNVKLWPNAVGFAFNGEVVSKIPKNSRYIILKNPRPVKYGLCPGSLDCIGFKTVIINGSPIPRFIAIDAKKDGDVLSDKQKRFIKMVRQNGGYADECRKPERVIDVFK